MIYTPENRTTTFIVGLLITLFFAVILTTFLILIQGKQITPDQGIIQTGVIRVNSVPSNVEIFINDKPANRNGNVVANLSLGINTVRLEKEGYSNWEKAVDVRPNGVNDVFAQLFPNEFNLNQVINKNIHKLFINQDMSKAVFTVLNSEISEEIGLWERQLSSSLLNFNNSNQDEKITTFDNEFINLISSSDYDIEESNGYYLFKIYSEKNAYYIYNKSDDLLEEISLFLGNSVDIIDLIGSNLVIMKNNILYSYNINNASQTIISLQESDDKFKYCISGNKVFFTRNNKLNYFDLANNRNSVILTNDTVVNIYCSKNEKVINVVNDKGELVAIQYDLNQFIKVLPAQSFLEIIQISNAGDKFLYKNNGEQMSVAKIINFERLTQNAQAEVITYLIEDFDYKYVNFSDSSNNLVLVKSNVLNGQEINSFYISDIDGQNTNKVFESEALSLKFIPRLSQDGKRIFLIINSSIIDEESISEEASKDSVRPVDNINLYRIDLVQ